MVTDDCQNKPGELRGKLATNLTWRVLGLNLCDEKLAGDRMTTICYKEMQNITVKMSLLLPL
jgi:hypothetical protein